MNKPDVESIKEFVLSLLTPSSHKLESLTIAIIKDKVSEHFNKPPEFFHNIIVKIVDEELTKMAIPTAEAAAAAALRRAIEEITTSGRPVTEPIQKKRDERPDHDSISENEEEPPKKKRYSSTTQIVINPLLIEFAGGKSDLTPREYANIVLEHCKLNNLESIPAKRVFKTDSILKTLLKNRATVSKFPNKIIEALKSSKMIVHKNVSN